METRYNRLCLLNLKAEYNTSRCSAAGSALGLGQDAGVQVLSPRPSNIRCLSNRTSDFHIKSVLVHVQLYLLILEVANLNNWMFDSELYKN